MKTAEQFFKAESEKQWLNSGSFSADPGSIARIPYVVYPAIFKVMDEYAAQQVAAERERIKNKIRHSKAALEVISEALELIDSL